MHRKRQFPGGRIHTYDKGPNDHQRIVVCRQIGLQAQHNSVYLRETISLKLKNLGNHPRLLLFFSSPALLLLWVNTLLQNSWRLPMRAGGSYVNVSRRRCLTIFILSSLASIFSLSICLSLAFSIASFFAASGLCSVPRGLEKCFKSALQQEQQEADSQGLREFVPCQGFPLLQFLVETLMFAQGNFDLKCNR